jgi:hypothetical protein
MDKETTSSDGHIVWRGVRDRGMITPLLVACGHGLALLVVEN